MPLVTMVKKKFFHSATVETYTESHGIATVGHGVCHRKSWHFDHFPTVSHGGITVVIWWGGFWFEL